MRQIPQQCIAKKKGKGIKGQEICNGAFFSCHPDGTDIKSITWRLRSSFGHRFSPEGRLITTINITNPMPPRGAYFDNEPVYELKKENGTVGLIFIVVFPSLMNVLSIKIRSRSLPLPKKKHRKQLNGKKCPFSQLLRCRCKRQQKESVRE